MTMKTASTTSEAMLYISTRPAPKAAPSDTVVQNLDLPPGTAASSVPFPKPEHVWMMRDVDREDWTAFTIQMLPRGENGAETEAARRRRMNYVLSEWNDEFFGPRGLEVQVEYEATKTGAASESSQTRGYGVKLGNSLVGVSLPPNSSGYWLRLGNVLLGVSTPAAGGTKTDTAKS